MNWFTEFSDALTEPFVDAPVWQQMGTIIAVGVPVLIVLAWALMMAIDWIATMVSSVSAPKG